MIKPKMAEQCKIALQRARYEIDYETATATTSEQVEQLGSEGWTKYDEMNGTHFYRRLKL